jgi:agmatine/peptidylarginine deiminase
MKKVFCANSLERLYSPVFSGIKDAAISHGHSFVVVDSPNYWLRDWMPVTGRRSHVQFLYRRDVTRYPQLATGECPVKSNRSSIVLDGGNCVIHESRAIVTDIIYEHNKGLSPWAVRDGLAGMLGCDVIVIPREPDDELGHSDGICAWVSGSTVFVNDYLNTLDPLHRSYARSLRAVLHHAGIDAVPFPFGYNLARQPSETACRARWPHLDEWNPCPGYHINMLNLGNVVLYPTFNLPTDDEVADRLGDYFDEDKVDFVPVDCSELCLAGGAVNCVTWVNDEE